MDNARIFALAGICQAISLAQELANHGDCNRDEFSHCIDTVFSLQADSIEDIYGHASNFKQGFVILTQLFQRDKRFNHSHLLAYFLAILSLERQLCNQPSIVDTLRQRIETVTIQADYFQCRTHSNVIENLADAYVDSIGSLRHRIIVQGDPHYLQQDDILARIRALLLAAIRSAVLWRQVGGSRWQLLVGRTRLLQQCTKLMQ